MDKIIALSEKAATDSSEIVFNEEKFVSFMRECPIWDFVKITQSSYIAQPHEEKVRLISQYYKLTSEGNSQHFCSFFRLFVWSGRL